eukprot:TRINITY_DN7650_c0_g1_i2.p1 TRINITY_DN7650_c0_g1~~TRINITY_DN7650_c0_g1_i2.p1  ORF type:complete len:636 (-),score=195.09 TRINITY_DN7650_c0_g1_i2:4-1911(-)
MSFFTDRSKPRKGSSAMLHVQVVEAKNLEAKDVTGTSDPYCTLKVGKNGIQKHKTKTILKTKNPVWNEPFTFGVSAEDLKHDLVIKIYDEDRFRDELIGRVLIPLGQLTAQNEIASWFTITDDAGVNPVPGNLYVRLVWEDKFSDDQKSSEFRARRSMSLSGRDRIRIGSFDAAEDKDNAEVISVTSCSWNVGNAPPPEDLSLWIPKEGYRIIAIGVQECKYDPRPPHATCAADWKACLAQHLPNYELVAESNLWEMRLSVFVEKNYFQFISNIEFTSEATGVAHVLGNKGGVVVSFSYKDSSFCFVNSHLAAHQNKCAGRNQNYSEIVEGSVIGTKHVDMLHQFHHVIWMGDLNYRLDYGDQGDDPSPSQETFEALVKEIDAENFDKLYYECDQLVREMKENRVFLGFTDIQPKFRPTFKVERNQPFTYKNQRSPAWCDRVLYRSMPHAKLEVTKFVCCPELLTSDHKPVRADFEATLLELCPGFTNSFGACTITFQDLSARNLIAADVCGTSDPYVRFFGTFLDPTEKPRTAAVDKNLNPDWKDEDLPTLKSMVNNPDRLSQHHLMIAVFDHDLESKDDPIGNAYLMLKEVVPASLNGDFTPFELNLYHAGLPAGTLSGKIRLNWAPSQASMH